MPAVALRVCWFQRRRQLPLKQNSGDTMVVTAAEQTRQAPGVSVITREDIQRRPPANDLSEIIRTMPGVNLTGNSTSGSRGNNRQIDIRGMGPDNTLILIDGKPVSSRASVRCGWRGDTNWVPSNMVSASKYCGARRLLATATALRVAW